MEFLIMRKQVEKCKNCAQKNGGYKEGVKSKTYSVSIKSNIHKNQKDFEYKWVA
ncbi:hypothetical protein KTC96_08345 [Clostridium estertheticum]|uniref:hypothetical protein n=1 Tax=Clostridium estertheticum TaxID=238834 RepID=UPI00129C15BC|nr:hypothetical protein [Clostridium estertheticum]MBX4262264.1 hypothetical protein [Clostridium estertheticum]WLC71990.1 hypothetical protein KTC96_08345 [Clostridium estertheticum]